MLLSHTAGFGYSFFNERLRDWGFPVGIDEFSGRFEDMKMPLLFQPGEGWEYGVCEVSNKYNSQNSCQKFENTTGYLLIYFSD